jgi:thymidine kinase
MRETVAGYGWVEVICGCMFSGKTEELIRRLQRAQIANIPFQVFKPIIDDRYSKDCVASHDSTRIPSITIKEAVEILDHLDDMTRVVGIDEAQFFASSIVEVVERLANRGVRVIVAGLDLDYRGQPFGPMPQLLTIAEKITKLSAICVVCGETATRTYRVSRGNSQVLVGAADHYQARCRRHHHFGNAQMLATEKADSKEPNKPIHDQSLTIEGHC